VRKSNPDHTWLQPLLRRGLRRVAAPRDLWDRVTLPRVEDVCPKPQRSFVWMIAGASVVTASLLAVAWGYYPSERVDREAYTPSGQQNIRMACLACHVKTAI
jgi:hypothetical protein